MPWKTSSLLIGTLAAADFFTVDVLTMAGLVRYVVLFVMKLKTHTVEIVGITRQPSGNWMTQVARNLTDADDGFLRGMEYLCMANRQFPQHLRIRHAHATYFDIELRFNGDTAIARPDSSPGLSRRMSRKSRPALNSIGARRRNVYIGNGPKSEPMEFSVATALRQTRSDSRARLANICCPNSAGYARRDFGIVHSYPRASEPMKAGSPAT